MHHRIRKLYLLPVIFLSLILSACTPNIASSETGSPNPERRLTISATFADSVWTWFSSEELHMIEPGTLRYEELTNVIYTVDGKTMELLDALNSGCITFAEISSYARADAENGICQEIYQSRRGLTHFTYLYPEFDLRIIHDIYETPDGKQHLINEVVFYAPGEADGPYTDFRDELTGYRLDREYWGVSFEVMEANSSGITIECTHSGGQQIGELYATGYAVLVPNKGGVPRLDGFSETPALNILLSENQTTVIEIDWADMYGQIPSGEYTILIDINDIFDSSQVHPLMVDYYNWQFYELDFMIP